MKKIACYLYIKINLYIILYVYIIPIPALYLFQVKKFLEYILKKRICVEEQMLRKSTFEDLLYIFKISLLK